MSEDKSAESKPPIEFVDGYEPYLEALYRSWKELEEIKVKERELAYRKAKLNESVVALRPLVFKHSWDINTLTLSDAIRFVFSTAKRPLTAIGVRTKLEDLGYNLQQFDNPLANIHTALRRMGDTDELSRSGQDEKKKAFEPGPELKPISEPLTDAPSVNEIQTAQAALGGTEEKQK